MILQGRHVKLEKAKVVMMTNIALVTMTLLLVLIGCAQEPSLDLEVLDKTRPSFSFSGRSVATTFEISELPRPKPLSKAYGLTGETVWRISVARGMTAAEWPHISYADVPKGFSQSVPENGPPPKLTEGKLYVARVLGTREEKIAMYFEIRNGKLMNITDKVFGP